MTAVEEKIHQLFSHADADVNACVIAYRLIDMAPENEKPQRLQQVFTEFRYTPTDATMKTPQVISEAEVKVLRDKFGFKVNSYVTTLQGAGYSEERYYRQLWRYLSAETALPFPKARAYGLYEIATGSNSCYRYFDPSIVLKMSPQAFQECCSKIGNKRKEKIKYILTGAGLADAAERASVLLHEMSELPDHEARVAYMALVLLDYEEKICRFISKADGCDCGD